MKKTVTVLKAHQCVMRMNIKNDLQNDRNGSQDKVTKRRDFTVQRRFLRALWTTLRLVRHNLHCFQKKKTVNVELNRGDKEKYQSRGGIKKENIN